MPVSPALTNDELVALAGPSTLKRYLSPVKDVVRATARTNQGSFVYPITQLTVDSTVDWTDVRVGDTVYVGSQAGTHDKGIYRVRLATNPTTLFIGEVSAGDPGQLPQAIRTAAFANDDYITVMQRFDVWSVLPFIEPVSGNIYEDYNRTPGTNNTTPPALVYVEINGRRNHLFDYITTADLAITATASTTPWPTSGASTQDYLWIVPSEWTDVTGDTTDTLTANAPPGNYILYLTVTDSVGGDTERVCYVNVHDADNNPPLLISDMPRSDTRDRSGRRMSFDLYDDRLAALVEGAAVGYFEVCTWGGGWASSGTALDGTLDDSATEFDVDDGSLLSIGDYIQIDLEQMLVTDVDTNTITVTRGYNGTTAATHASGAIVYVFTSAQDVPTATRQFVGWIQQNDRVTDTGLRQASIEMIGPAGLLQLLNSTSQLIQFKSSPTTWQQAVPALCSSTFMAWYMLQWRVANLLKLFNFTVFDVAATGQRLPSWQIDKGTIYQQIQLLATDRGNFGANSEGEFFFLRQPNMVDYASRSGIVIRDELTVSEYSIATISVQETNRVQQVRGEAFSWNGIAALPTPYYSDAPKSPGQGTSQIKLPSQVVTDQAELNQLTGDYYAWKNNRYPSVTANIQKNRDVYEPAELPFVLVTVPANLSPDGVVFESNCIPVSVSKRHNADGTADIELQMEGETAGIDGVFVQVPVSNISIFVPPSIPNINVDIPPPNFGGFVGVIVPPVVPSPSEPDVVPGKGAIRNTGAEVFRTYDVTVEPPEWDDVTPAGFTQIMMVIFDHSANFSRGAFVLGNDGVDSFVAKTEDIFASTPVWEIGGTTGGIYSSIRSIEQTDNIIIYGVAGAAWCYLFDFTIDDGGFTADEGVWTPGVGWVGAPYGSGGGLSGLNILFSQAAITSIGVIHTASGYGATQKLIRTQRGGDTPTDHLQGGAFNGTNISTIYTIPGDPAPMDNIKFFWDGAGSFDVVITSIEICGVGFNPFDDTDNKPQTAYSPDGGATWDAPVEVGDAPGGVGGFDVSAFGIVNIGGADEQARIQTEINAAYTDATEGDVAGAYPATICIPRYRIGSVSLTNISDSPSYYMMTNAEVIGQTVFRIVAASRAAITPEIMGTPAIAVSANGFDAWKGKLAVCLGDVGGTTYVFTTKTSGTFWFDEQLDGVMSVRARRYSPTGKEWLIAQLGDTLQYSSDQGITWSERTATGANIYAEIFG